MRRSSPLLAGLFAAALLAGCGGNSEKPESPALASPPATVPPVAPAPAPPSTAPLPLGPASVEVPLRRLSATQYLNTLRDLALRANPVEGTQVANELPALTAAYPRDALVNASGEKHGGFHRLDQTIQQAQVEAAFNVAFAVATEMTRNARIGQMLGACATDSVTTNDDACLRTWIRSFARMALRRPLTDAEVETYRAAAGGTPLATTSVASVITLMLGSPQFMYFVEHGQPTVLEPRAPLTAHELATRLSYHFWQSMPDAELSALADSGALTNTDTWRAQVARLTADARTERTAREFFSQWFRLHELEELDSRVGEPNFDLLRGSYLPTRDTRENAIAEVEDLVSWQLRNNGTLQSVLTSRQNFARTADLAALYGSPPWNGTATPVDLTDPARAGLITRVAFVASGSANTRPIMKGYRIRSALLCQVMPPPPPDAMNAVVNLSGQLTTREVVERLTETPGTACAACHVRLLNPMGFATENFDALGRTRTAQQLIEAGRLVGTKAVSTATVPYVLANDARGASDARQLTQYIAESGEFERCFAQEYFRYTFARREQSIDAPVLAELREAARAGVPLRQLLAHIALRPEFMVRDFR